MWSQVETSWRLRHPGRAAKGTRKLSKVPRGYTSAAGWILHFKLPQSYFNLRPAISVWSQHIQKTWWEDRNISACHLHLLAKRKKWDFFLQKRCRRSQCALFKPGICLWQARNKRGLGITLHNRKARRNSTGTHLVMRPSSVFCKRNDIRFKAVPEAAVDKEMLLCQLILWKPCCSGRERAQTTHHESEAGYSWSQKAALFLGSLLPKAWQSGRLKTLPLRKSAGSGDACHWIIQCRLQAFPFDCKYLGSISQGPYLVLKEMTSAYSFAGKCGF